MTDTQSIKEKAGDYVWNAPVGSGDADEFIAVSENRNAYIKKLIFYSNDTGSADREAPRSIQIEWSDGKKETIGKPSGSSRTKLFVQDEKILEMVLGADYSPSRLTLRASRVPDDVWYYGWAEGREKKQQDLGNGLLAGFHGTTSDQIYKIGAVFWKKI